VAEAGDAHNCLMETSKLGVSYLRVPVVDSGVARLHDGWPRQVGILVISHWLFVSLRPLEYHWLKPIRRLHRTQYRIGHPPRPFGTQVLRRPFWDPH